MEFKVRRENYNPVLSRKEVHLEIDHDRSGTPTRVELRKAVAAKYGVKADNVYVVNMQTNTGTRQATCEVQVYDDPKFARMVVPKHVQTRNLPPEERKRAAEEKAKEEPKPKPEKPKVQKGKEEAQKETKSTSESDKKAKEAESK